MRDFRPKQPSGSRYHTANARIPGATDLIANLDAALQQTRSSPENTLAAVPASRRPARGRRRRRAWPALPRRWSARWSQQYGAGMPARQGPAMALASDHATPVVPLTSSLTTASHRLHSGWRLSAKAATPSRASSVDAITQKLSTISATLRRYSASLTRLYAARAMRITDGDLDAKVSASICASGSTSSSAKTRLINPSRSASAGPNRRPLKRSSNALCFPIIRGR